MTHAIAGEEFTRPEENTVKSTERLDSVRYHYMDNLRAIAMLAGIFFHAALAYSPLMQNLWLSADAQNSQILDAVAWFMHLFRMPLFFLISGFFAVMLMEKRGIVSFLKNRGLRIALPFAIFLPLILISFILLIGWSISAVESHSPMLQFIAATYNNPDVPQPPFSTTHLWFLFNLGLFCLVIALIKKFNFFESKIARKMANSHFIIFGLPLLLVPALYSQPAPLPAPERIYPELWSFGFFGIFFILGGIIYNNQQLLEPLKKYNLALLLVSLIGYAVLYQYLPKTLTFADIMTNMQGIPHSTEQFIKAILAAFISVHMTIFCLVAGRTLLDSHNKIFRLISNSSYWVYIVHLPVLFYLQFLLLDLEMNLWLKFLTGAFGTLAIGMISYVLFIKWTPIGWLLNGRKKP